MEPLEEYKDPQEDYKYKYKERVQTPFPETILKLDCPSCSTPIKAENINIDNTLAKCEHCDTIFNFEKDIPSRRLKPEVLLPSGMEVLKLRSELEIQYKWRKRKNDGFQSFFTIVWNAMLLPFALGAIMSGQLIILLFMSAHLIIGMKLLYDFIASIINTTYVTADENSLSIEHRPLRKLKKTNNDIPVDDIKQIFVEKYVSGRVNTKVLHAYSVNVVLKNNRKIRFIDGLKHPEQAQYIEQEIEWFLGIDDERVRGEFREK